MINRVLIRIRVLQTLYSSYQSENQDLKTAETNLMFSLQKSYDLYFYFLLLLVELTDTYEKRVELAKSKLLPTEKDINPNIKLLENKFIKLLRDSEQMNDYLADRPLSWHENENFVKNTLESILSSSVYEEYLAADDSYETDREFCRKVFKKFICANEELADILEEQSLYWNDDIEIVESFVLKTIKKLSEDDQTLLPMFKDEDDSLFAVKLLRESMFNAKEYRELIGKYAKNWESERIAFMDLIIMQIAIAEIMTFPSIPVSVTLNEYINIAKSYSTAKSPSFINGILDAVVAELKEAKKIIKK